MMAILKYREEKEDINCPDKLNEFFPHRRARVTQAFVQRRIIQVSQERHAV